MENSENRYLRCLAEVYPNIAATSKEIINLQSIINLPKGTEHFVSDIHGEYAAFYHVIRNGSGAVRKKIDDVFGHTLDNAAKRSLATLIYYPREKIRIAKENERDIENWYYVTIYRLIKICKVVSSKYTSKHVSKAMPDEYEYIILELMNEKPEVLNKEAYYNSIVETIIEIGQAEDFIFALCEVIQELVIDRLHVIGDIFDRGPAPHKIMDALMDHHSVDIQWGNHDIVWMGAALGQHACMATIIRNAARYANMDVLEDGYGIATNSLVELAMEVYTNDPCTQFPVSSVNEISKTKIKRLMKVQKAIAVIQFKLEGQLILKYPEFHMDNRLLLDKMDLEKGTITIDGEEYPLLDTNFPTIDMNDPYQLTEREQHVVDRLSVAFRHSEKLQKHVHFLMSKGNIYTVYNQNLLFHGCVPLNADGSFKKVNIFGKEYAGKALYDALEKYVRKAATDTCSEKEKERGRDMMWYIWCSPESPLFGKSKMATMETYFVGDKNVRKEIKNSYWTLLNNPETADKILEEFGCTSPESRIINGHVPVHQMDGESPIKCKGKVLVIDGGFSKPYQKVTGIAGYTLIYNSYGMTLAAHEPFVDTKTAIAKEADIISHREPVYTVTNRRLIRDTDEGQELIDRIKELKKLLAAFRNGSIKEKKTK